MEILSYPALSAILRHMGKFGAFASRLKETVARIKDRKNVVAQEETEEAPPIRLSDEAMAFIRTFSADGEGGRKAASEESRSFARKIAAEFRNFADTTITTLRISPDVEKAMQKGFSTASKEVREMGFGAGMGLPNIQENADDLKIETGVGRGTTLSIYIKF